MDCKLLLFDLDGTLLRSDKTISKRTLLALWDCRKRGIRIGVSTSRGRQNVLAFLGALAPDVLITSGGALAEYNGRQIFQAGFSREETRRLIAGIREVCGPDCEITADTADAHFWNYKTDPKAQDQSWGDSVYTDFADFRQASLKVCAEIWDEAQAERLKELFPGCDCIRFSDGYWYKFTRKGVTKERALREVCAACGIGTGDVFAFGDDYADIGMLQLCGRGIAMGNAIDTVKAMADLVIGSNDEDGIAGYLEEYLGEETAEPRGRQGAAGEAMYFRGARRSRRLRALRHKRHLIRLWKARKRSIFPPVLYVESSRRGRNGRKRASYYKRNTPTHGGGTNRYLKRMASRKTRRYRGGIARGRNYKKLFDYQWMLW